MTRTKKHQWRAALELSRLLQRLVVKMMRWTLIPDPLKSFPHPFSHCSYIIYIASPRRFQPNSFPIFQAISSLYLLERKELITLCLPSASPDLTRLQRISLDAFLHPTASCHLRQIYPAARLLLFLFFFSGVYEPVREHCLAKHAGHTRQHEHAQILRHPPHVQRAEELADHYMAHRKDV